jgi:hypothetical protein
MSVETPKIEGFSEQQNSEFVSMLAERFDLKPEYAPETEAPAADATEEPAAGNESVQEDVAESEVSQDSVDTNDSGVTEQTDKGESTPAADWATPALLRLATNYGLSKEDAQEFGSEKALFKFMDIQDRQYAAQREEKQQTENSSSSPKEKNVESSISAQLDKWIESQGDDYHESTKELVDIVKVAFREQQKQLDEALNWQRYAQDAARRHQAAEDTAWLDEQFSKNPHLKSLFGEGSIDKVLNDAKLYGNRSTVAKRTDFFMNENPQLTRLQAFNKALQTEFHEEIREIESRERNRKIVAQSQRKLGVPTKPKPQGQTVDDIRDLARNAEFRQRFAEIQEGN